MVPRLCLLLAALARAAPEFPLQFRAVVSTTAHLVDRAQDYPPWLRRVELDYDYVNKRARAAVLLGWTGGQLKHVRRHERIWHDLGFETVTAAQSIDDTFFPPAWTRLEATADAALDRAGRSYGELVSKEADGFGE